METRGNYFIVGLFTAVMLIIGLGFVMWLSLQREDFDTKRYRIEFEGSVQGLSPSAPVYFNGLKVGNVSRISLDPDNPKIVFALVDIADYVPMRVDTRAQLNYQGVTGVADIQLTGASNTAPLIESQNGNLPTLRAEPSIFQDLLASGREVMTEVRIVLSRMSSILGENGALLNSSLRNVNEFSATLAENSGKIEEFMSAVGNSAKSIEMVSNRLDKFVVSADEFAEDIDTDGLKETFSEVQAFARTIASTKDSVRLIVQNAATISGKLEETTSRINQILAVANTFEEDDLNLLLNNSNLTLEEFRSLANNINTEIATTSPLIKNISQNIENFTNKELKGVAKLVDGGELTLEEYRTVAKNLNSEITDLATSLKQVTGNLEKLSSRTLKEVSATLQKTREAADSISKAARKLEQEPQSIIFGDGVSKPQYDGANRR